jgi:hypothetical protein
MSCIDASSIGTGDGFSHDGTHYFFFVKREMRIYSYVIIEESGLKRMTTLYKVKDEVTGEIISWAMARCAGVVLAVNDAQALYRITYKGSAAVLPGCDVERVLDISPLGDVGLVLSKNNMLVVDLKSDKIMHTMKNVYYGCIDGRRICYVTTNNVLTVMLDMSQPLDRVFTVDINTGWTIDHEQYPNVVLSQIKVLSVMCIKHELYKLNFMIILKWTFSGNNNMKLVKSFTPDRLVYEMHAVDGNIYFNEPSERGYVLKHPKRAILSKKPIIEYTDPDTKERGLVWVNHDDCILTMRI